MSDLVYKIQNVGVYYQKTSSFPWIKNKFWALRDISFNIYLGETVGIIGRNGAGKSTLLRVLAGIFKPDIGSIWRANVSVAMQSIGAGFDPRLTGRQNIFLNGLLLGMSRRYISERVQDIIDLADVGEFIDEPIKHYSSGMRARLGFSIAYYINTDIILIDETLAVGDQAFQEKASVLIKEKIRSDHTIILITHSASLVKELCNRVLHIQEGYLLPELPVQESIDRYLSSNK